MMSRIRNRAAVTIAQLHEHGRYRSRHSHHSAHSLSYRPRARLFSRQTIQTWTFLQDQARDKGLEAPTEIIAGIRTLLRPSMTTNPLRWPDPRPGLQLRDIYAIVVQYHTRRISLDDR
jgi:hypothetical protein